MTVEKTFVVGVNEDLDFAARWTDELGQPYTLTAAFCQVRPQKGNEAGNEPVLDLSSSLNGITIDVDQWAVVHVPASTIATIEPDFYYFDLVLERSDGKRYRPVKGQINIEAGVTYVA